MLILLLIGAGLGIGSFLSWLVARRPFLLSRSVSIKTENRYSGTSLFAILFVVCVILNFYGLGVGSFSGSEMAWLGFLFLILSATALFDISHRLIPNRILIAGTAGWICFALTNILPILPSLLAGTCAAFIFLLIRLLGFLFYKKAGMGIGDIKLVFLMGLFLQWGVFWSIYLAIFAGGLWAIAGLILQKFDRTSRFAFAPFLWAGASVAIFLLPFDKFLALWI